MPLLTIGTASTAICGLEPRPHLTPHAPYSHSGATPSSTTTIDKKISCPNAILKGHTSQPSHQHIEPHPMCQRECACRAFPTTNAHAVHPKRECSCSALASTNGPAIGTTSSLA